MDYELLSESRNLISEGERGWGRGEGVLIRVTGGGGEMGIFFEKIEVGGTLIRDLRVVKSYDVKCQISYYMRQHN